MENGTPYGKTCCSDPVRLPTGNLLPSAHPIRGTAWARNTPSHITSEPTTVLAACTSLLSSNLASARSSALPAEPWCVDGLERKIGALAGAAELDRPRLPPGVPM